MNRLDSSELRALCIRENWFTSGTIRQYERLFERNEQGASINELSTIIWICSEPNIRKDDIYSKIFTECGKKTFL